jgi:hypothetical protein
MLTTLSKQKFGDFENFEVLVRTFERRKLKETSILKQEETSSRDDKFVFAQPNNDEKWHTGYLSFCTKF